MLVKAAIAASLALALVVTGSGALQAQTPEPASSTATATATPEKKAVTATVSPKETPLSSTPTAAPATPLPETDKPGALVGYVIEDTDGNGVRSASDRSTETLVQLILTDEGRIYYGDGTKTGEGVKTALLMTDDAGRFEFDDLLPGEYELTVWWSPGFVSVQDTVVPEKLILDQGWAGMLTLGVAVTSDGAKTYRYSAREALGDSAGWRTADVEYAPPIPSGALVILGRPNTEGLFPYPVSTGEGSSGPVPVGRVSFAQISMPSSGDGDDKNNIALGWWLAVGGGVLLVATTAFLRVERRLRRR